MLDAVWRRKIKVRPGSREVDVEHLHGIELLEDRARGETGGFEPQLLTQGGVETKGQEGPISGEGWLIDRLLPRQRNRYWIEMTRWHAAKGKSGDRATEPMVDFHWWQRGIGYCSKDSSGYGSEQARELAPELLGRKGGKATGGNYSTGQTAQRLSAISSIRLGLMTALRRRRVRPSNRAG